MGNKALIIVLILVGSVLGNSEINFPRRAAQPLLSLGKADNNDSSLVYKSDFSLNKERKKSPAAAMGLSLIVPGAGQVYNGSYWRGALYAGVEILSWTMVAIYNGKGSDVDAEFKRYADAHWSEPVYWAKVYQKADEGDRFPDLPRYGWNVNEPSAPADLPDWVESGFIPEYTTNAELQAYLRNIETQVATTYTHRLPETKTQQYYEMIGKYSSQFGNGWDDADFNHTYNGYNGDLTARNKEYYDMRNLSNDYYDIATGWMSAALINHLVSSLDALWTAKKMNRNFGVSYQPRFIEGHLVNSYAVRIEF
jgi:hypothetical protein